MTKQAKSKRAAELQPADWPADEPQTAFLPPAEGGSYRRNPDGSLTRIFEQPSQITTDQE